MGEVRGGNPNVSRGSWFKKLRDMPNDSPLKSVVVALLVCIFCSVLVSGSAVLLRPMQIANGEKEQRERLSEIISLLPDVVDHISTTSRLRLETHLVELTSGRYVPDIDAQGFDQRQAVKDPEQSIDISPEHDLAQIGRRAKLSVVRLVYDGKKLELVIIPVRGRGFGSMLYGYLGLSGDMQKVIGLSFYEHAETPGLGSVIDSQAWRDKWKGKMVWDETGKPGLGVSEGIVDPNSPKAAFLVDGLTGATWTSRGVNNLLRFWLGDFGFGPYLRKLRNQRG